MNTECLFVNCAKICFNLSMLLLVDDIVKASKSYTEKFDINARIFSVMSISLRVAE